MGCVPKKVMFNAAHVNEVRPFFGFFSMYLVLRWYIQIELSRSATMYFGEYKACMCLHKRRV